MLLSPDENILISFVGIVFIDNSYLLIDSFNWLFSAPINLVRKVAVGVEFKFSKVTELGTFIPLKLNTSGLFKLLISTA